MNNIQKDKNKYNNDPHNYANIDNRLSHAQASIGLSSNMAQIAQTYMYNFKDQKYIDYVCILSVLAQVSIDSAKRSFDVDLISEIDRISKDMDIEKNGYPVFWKHIKDKKKKIGEKKFNKDKINKELKCPMNYLMDLKFSNSRSKDSTLSMDYFFQKFELETNRRQSKKVEKLIEDYSLCLFKYNTLGDKEFSSDNKMSSQHILLRSDFDDMIEDIKKVYISKTYLGLMSWLIDRAFEITPQVKGKDYSIKTKINNNKSLLLKVLYDINPNNLLKIFSKNS